VALMPCGGRHSFRITDRESVYPRSRRCSPPTDEDRGPMSDVPLAFKQLRRDDGRVVYRAARQRLCSELGFRKEESRPRIFLSRRPALEPGPLSAFTRMRCACVLIRRPSN